ncbi:response regulator transcription factor [Rhizobium sp. 1AS11]|uniref:response regulator transcription factor n=1 Tax=Rhizobium acaciae TaxID=2989736 RepID=UPI0022226604|nr:response regulator transcription factor [Rhizobium acaciae]MCW1412960.1 response regulator transcription factor [Rhizobium acaciae]MCW1745112.1 response regulator transcription factor [Rhizobium acaciae]
MAHDNNGDPLPPPLVLIAAADVSFRLFLEYTVKGKGLVVSGVSDGETLVKRVEELVPDLLLLESRLRGFEAQTLCACLRKNHRTRSTSIIAIAAEGDEASRKAILESGADQYLCRPFSPETLLESIGAIWPSSDRDYAVGNSILTFLDLELDVCTYRVRRNGRLIHLPPTEFRLLCHFIKNPYRVFSRDELQDAAWPRAVHLGPRTVDVHIGRLRAALNKAGGRDLIRTVWSVGYALSE